MPDPIIAITAAGAVSPLGADLAAWESNCFLPKSFIRTKKFNGQETPVAFIPEEAEQALLALVKERKSYQHLDRSVLLALLAARQFKQQISTEDKITGVSIGSSRGATGIWEQRFAEFASQEIKKLSPLTSPTTTLGNVASWVMNELELCGPALSHSVTCSSSWQSIANAVAWMRAGMADRFVAGGTEAPLTDFTIAQMKALRIYSQETNAKFPCRPLSDERSRSDSFVLGEGASLFLLEKMSEQELQSKKPFAIIESIGFGSEPVNSLTGITESGMAFQKAMRSAISGLANDGHKIDLIMLHAPGTIKGEAAELAAIKEVFGENVPTVYSNKWQIGHTLGSAAAFNLLQAVTILKEQSIPRFPYDSIVQRTITKPVKRIMINATGFGGNAGCLVISAV